jgi:class 3 adenylate cyclase
MFSDIQDYTASTAAAQRLAVVNLVRRHRDVVAPIADRLGGTIIKSLGDGLLLTFTSATDGVRAGLEIQAAANQTDFRNAEKLPLRIGIATGEVILVDGDVLGEAVNLASRIQQLAASGEVLFSDSTRATLHRAEVKFEDLGQREIKGLDTPVHVYKAVASGAIASV